VQASPMPSSISEKTPDLLTLASQFGAAIPEDEFSTAELQGFLLAYKTRPADAVDGVSAWIEAERAERLTREDRERKRLEKTKDAKLRREAKQTQAANSRNDAIIPLAKELVPNGSELPLPNEATA
jgi:chaperone BCS1